MNTKTLQTTTNPNDFSSNYHIFKYGDTMNNEIIKLRKEKVESLLKELPVFRKRWEDEGSPTTRKLVSYGYEFINDCTNIKELNVKKRYKVQLTKSVLPILFSLLSVGDKLENKEVVYKCKSGEYSVMKNFYKDFFEENMNCEPYYNMEFNPCLTMTVNYNDFLKHIICRYAMFVNLYKNYILEKKSIDLKYYYTKNSGITIVKFSAQLRYNAHFVDKTGNKTDVRDQFQLIDDENRLHSYIIYVNDQILTSQKMIIETLEDLIKRNKFDDGLDDYLTTLHRMVVEGSTGLLDENIDSYNPRDKILFNSTIKEFERCGYEYCLYPSSIYLLDQLYGGLSSRYYVSKKFNGLYLVRINKDVGYVSLNRKALESVIKGEDVKRRYIYTVKRFAIR